MKISEYFKHKTRDYRIRSKADRRRYAGRRHTVCTDYIDFGGTPRRSFTERRIIMDRRNDECQDVRSFCDSNPQDIINSDTED